MKLTVTTPLEIVLETDIVALRAEDASGGFGVLPGHADFLTVLAISVISWTDAAGRRAHVAVRGGVLSVTGGASVAVTTREAVAGDDLATLSDTVLTRFREAEDIARTEHADTTRLHLAGDPPDRAGAGQRPGDAAMSEDDDRLAEAARLRHERHERGRTEGEVSVARRLGQIGVLGWLIVDADAGGSWRWAAGWTGCSIPASS